MANDDEIPLLLGNQPMPRTADWISLPKPWGELSASMRAKAVSAFEIRTYDKGLLKNVDGHWMVVRSGDVGDADLVLTALQKPS